MSGRAAIFWGFVILFIIGIGIVVFIGAAERAAAADRAERAAAEPADRAAAEPAERAAATYSVAADRAERAQRAAAAYSVAADRARRTLDQ